MAEAQSQEAPKSKHLLLIVVIVVLLLVIAVGATLFFTGAFGHKNAASGKDASAATEAAAEVKKPPLYLSITPPLVVNFQNPQPARFLQVGIDVMARDKKILDEVKQNMPAIRNRLIILLSGQKYAQINSPEGKQTLRKQVLDSINEALDEAGVKEKVEKVYFTSFVMQ